MSNIDNENMEKNTNEYSIDSNKYKIIEYNNDDDVENMKEDELIYKVILIGDQNVGKTSIIQKLVTKYFNKKYNSTIGFDIFYYRVKINDKIIKLNIWDTCGMKDFFSCTKNIFTDVALAIIAYSIDSRESFDNLEGWINTLKANSSPNVLKFIVGNKCDLVDEREVQKDEGEKLKNDNNYNFFIETSAKDDKFVTELFDNAIVQLYELNKLMEEKDGDELKIDFKRRKSFVINDKKPIEMNDNKNNCTC
jgi:small GTP-binding protein